MAGDTREEGGSVTPTDIFGQPITVGSIVVYGQGLGRCAALSAGEVISIGPYANNYSYKDWKITVRRPRDVVHRHDWPAADMTRVDVHLNFPDRMYVTPETPESFWARFPEP